MDERTREIIEKVKTSAKAVGDLTIAKANDVSKKASSVYEKGKINLKIFNIQNEIDLLYKSIGRELYEAHLDADAETPDFEELFIAVDEKQQEIQELRAQQDVLRNSKKCPNPDCGKSCSKDDAYCPACGAKLDE